MRSLIILLMLLLVSSLNASCSTTSNKSNKANQSISLNNKESLAKKTTSKNTNNATSIDDSDLLDDSITPNNTSNNSNNKIQAVKISTTITPFVESNLVITKVVPASNKPQASASMASKIAVENNNQAKAPAIITTESNEYTTIRIKKTRLPIKTWKISLSDRVISNTLERWAEENGYQLVWKFQHDFEITSEAVITGTIRDAFNQVLLSFIDSSSPIRATWYKNKVIVITAFNE